MRNYRNTLVYSIKPSEIESRLSEEIDTTVEIMGVKLTTPLISAPMDTINSSYFFHKIRELGGLGTIHRRMSIGKQLDIFNDTQKETVVSIGLNDFERAEALFSHGARNFLVDVANGYSIHIKPTVDWLKDKGCNVMAGNVAELNGFSFLAGLGVDAIRVGIGTGSACTTRRMTGIGYPIIDAIHYCKKYNGQFSGKMPAIIADGGIKEPSHVVKAIVAGADACMMGYTFARTVESTPGLNRGDSRTYRGMASFGAQVDDGKKPIFVEGESFPMSVDTTLEETMDYYKSGLLSAMTYLNARTYQDMRNNGRFVSIDPNDGEGYKGV